VIMQQLLEISAARASHMQAALDIAGMTGVESIAQDRLLDQVVFGEPVFEVRRCRFCGCTDDDCSQCIERTGSPCWWHTEDVCSACVPTVDLMGETVPVGPLVDEVGEWEQQNVPDRFDGMD